MPLDNLPDQLPYYLTRKAGDDLLRELKNYSDKTNIYLKKDMQGILQGDCWSRFSVYDHATKTVLHPKGIVLSNSCDIDKENKRELPSKITFAPLMKLSNLIKAFQSSGISQQAIDNKVKDIRNQRTTQFVFLPKAGHLDDDYVVWLSDTHSMPLDAYLQQHDRQKVFTLNMTGFYLLLFKVSVHFCRFHEEVDRFPVS